MGLSRKQREQQRRACEGKQRHPNETKAIAHATSLRRKGVRVMAYSCNFCTGWHVGHPPRHVRQKIAARRR